MRKLVDLPEHSDAVALDTADQLVFVGVKETGILVVSYTGQVHTFLAQEIVLWCEGLAVDQQQKLVRQEQIICIPLVDGTEIHVILLEFN